MTKEAFLSALKDLVNRAETEEEYLEHLVDDARDLIEEYEEDE